jgi:hypothetical protein
MYRRLLQTRNPQPTTSVKRLRNKQNIYIAFYALASNVYGKVMYKNSRVKGQGLILSLSPFTGKNATFYKTRDFFF